MKTPFGKAAAGQRSRTGTGHASVSVTVMKRKAAHKKHRSRPTSQPRRNIVGCRIQHGWKDGDEPLTQWKGTVLDQFKFTGHGVQTTEDILFSPMFSLSTFLLFDATSSLL
uniref:Uncharacterized protein n=1 Tax=Propithecus coquereli TaxID=379532 RepID=A0A2K6GSI4_PROCO